VRIVAISDTHGLHHRITDCLPLLLAADVIIHAGDCLRHGSRDDLAEFLRWYSAMPYPHKILVAGNHDWAFERHPEEARDMCLRAGVIYLQDQQVRINGFNFYGSPWTPMFYNWAFMLDRGFLWTKWAKIPTDTDVLITHGPPRSILDQVTDPPTEGPWAQAKLSNQGCDELRQELARVQPRVHIFGHIHEGYGRVEGAVSSEVITRFYNVSTCDRGYNPVNRS